MVSTYEELIHALVRDPLNPSLHIKLADHALRDGAGLKGVIEAEATDVRVGADALDARDVLDL